MTKRKIIILIFVLVLLLTGAAVGYYFYNKGPVSVEDARAEKVEATALQQAFIKDAAAAQKKYSGKILIVSGRIAQATINQNGFPIILLHTTAGAGFINCTLEEENTTSFKVGQSIRLKGICSGMGEADTALGLQPDLYLERCIVQP